MAGFGGAGFVTGLVPGLNFLMLPTLVTAGTLLVLRYPLPGDGEQSAEPSSPLKNPSVAMHGPSTRSLRCESLP